jgi:hypothetical protein
LVGVLFSLMLAGPAAALPDYNPMGKLISHDVLRPLPPDVAATLTVMASFPVLMTGPFNRGPGVRLLHLSLFAGRCRILAGWPTDGGNYLLSL